MNNNKKKNNKKNKKKKNNKQSNDNNDENELWERCAELLERAVNGNEEAVKELEDISNNNENDFVCLGYLLMCYNKVADRSPYLQIYNVFWKKLVSLVKSLNFELLSSNMTNKHQQFVLGLIFELGIGVPVNPTEGLKWYKLSADQNFSLAEHEVGYYYYNGTDVQRDIVVAFEYLTRGALKGYSPAQQYLGLCHYLIRPNEALHWLEKSASQGYPSAMFTLGTFYAKFAPEDPTLAFKWLKKSAEAKFPQGETFVGWYYLEGIGVEKNEEEGVTWLKIAVNKNESDAHYYLGRHYLKSEDPLKQQEGDELMRTAAERGNSKAQFEVGLNYFLGNRVKMDEEEAIKWFELAADNGNTQLEIAKLCRYGNLKKQHKEEFVKLAGKLNRQMISNLKTQHQSLSLIEYIMLDGVKVLENSDQLPVPRWISPEEAFLILARCYEFGLGVERDPVKAHKWYHNLKKFDLFSGDYHFGRCLEEGIGVIVDVERARRYYEEAARMFRNLDAIARLREYEEDRVSVRFGRKMRFEK